MKIADFGFCVLEVTRECLSGKGIDLQSPDHSDLVILADKPGIVGVHIFKLLSQDLQALLSRFFLQSLAYFDIPSRSGEEPFEESLEIKAGAAHNEGEFAPLPNETDSPQALSDKIGGGELYRRGDEIQEMVRNPLPHFKGRLVCADIKSLVDLTGITIDDFSVELLREADCGCALAHTRGA